MEERQTHLGKQTSKDDKYTSKGGKQTEKMLNIKTNMVT